MNFKYYLIFFVILFLSNCSNTVNLKKFTSVENFSNKGFTLVYEDKFYKNKIVDKKMDNRSYLIFQKNLKKNSSVKLTNMLNNKAIIAKVISNKTNYPYFYNSVISQRIAEDLNLDLNEPYISISLISNNSSFIAKKTKTWEEEKEVAEKAPVDGIVINDLNKDKTKKKIIKDKKFSYSIKIADFYYEKSALEMIKRIKNETSIKNFKLLPLSKTNFRVILGPFIDINSLKNSYNKAAILNFENLEIIRHD
mgnify:CR=1 FL=1|tara:strand:- start:8012 stop:8764 length:753 start_codon:yes stop_codon:yes gene_type:complete